MRVLIVDADCTGLDFALRCADWGHEVKWAIPRDPKGGLGLLGKDCKDIQRVSDWMSHAAWAKDGIIFPTCNNRHIENLWRCRKHGLPVIGPTPMSASLEIDRTRGMDLFDAAEIQTPPFEAFNSLKEAEKHVRKTGERYVFKTLGSEEDKSLSYVSKGAADLVGRLQSWQKQGLKLKGPCMLQEFIPGIEVGISAWMGREGFIKNKYNIAFEFKKLMPGNYGPNTGEMGTVIQYVKKDPLYDALLEPLEPYLVGLSHIGDFAMNAIVDSKGQPWVLEATARAGWPHFFIVQGSHTGDPVEWMRDLWDGKDTLQVDRRVHIGAILAQPPFPYAKSSHECSEGVPVLGITDDIRSQVHPVSMMQATGPVQATPGGPVTDGPIWRTTGDYVACISGAGHTVSRAKKDMMGVIDQIQIPNMIMRQDIGDHLEHSLPKLHSYGMCLQMEYS